MTALLAFLVQIPFATAYGPQLADYIDLYDGTYEFVSCDQDEKEFEDRNVVIKTLKEEDGSYRINVTQGQLLPRTYSITKMGTETTRQRRVNEWGSQHFIEKTRFKGSEFSFRKIYRSYTFQVIPNFSKFSKTTTKYQLTADGLTISESFRSGQSSFNWEARCHYSRL